ncbi:unnamed protein product [Menidia menidia]|uniref:(Atlantic silverside) hypothetical protein n=1 Tax=Menidia menidia TaxID=238744 RepID=A0A8S4BB23_9TELE|nr:unnamed protein product [Menidia menidia]
MEACAQYLLPFKNQEELLTESEEEPDAFLWPTPHFLFQAAPFSETRAGCVEVEREEMAALRSLSFCLLAVGLLLPAASTEQRITAEAGQDSVTLPCSAEKEKRISTVEWSIPDLDPDTVLYYIDGHFLPDRQHPSFRNRVDLQDRQMKEGNASLILKDVTMNDIGTYKCVIQSKGDMGFFFETFIYLDVTPPGKAPPTSEAPPTSGAPPPDSSPHHFGLMLLLRLLVFCPYFISTLLLVSVYRLRAKEGKQLVSMTTAPPLQAEPGLVDDYDDVTTEHHF